MFVAEALNDTRKISEEQVLCLNVESSMYSSFSKINETAIEEASFFLWYIDSGASLVMTQNPFRIF